MVLLVAITSVRLVSKLAAFLAWYTFWFCMGSGHKVVLRPRNHFLPNSVPSLHVHVCCNESELGAAADFNVTLWTKPKLTYFIQSVSSINIAVFIFLSPLVT